MHGANQKKLGNLEVGTKYLIKNLDTGETFWGMNDAGRSVGSCELIRQAIHRAGLSEEEPPYEFESHGYRWLCTAPDREYMKGKGRRHYGIDKKILEEWPNTRGSIKHRIEQVSRKAGLSQFATALWLHYNGVIKTSEQFREKLFYQGRIKGKLTS